MLVSSLGCSLGPKSFRDVVSEAPLVRARAVGLGEGLPDSVAVPALLDRLSDPDPVVRLSAHEALKRRTGQDFGYVPWAEPNDRRAAAARWRAWWSQRQASMPQPRGRRELAR
jgi:HEAT repeat protein